MRITMMTDQSIYGSRPWYMILTIATFRIYVGNLNDETLFVDNNFIEFCIDHYVVIRILTIWNGGYLFGREAEPTQMPRMSAKIGFGVEIRSLPKEALQMVCVLYEKEKEAMYITWDKYYFR
jgi:hypothetical protein